MKLSHKSVIAIYERLKKIAVNQYKGKKYLKSLDYITYAAKWAYLLNFRYSDKELENLIIKVTECNIGKINLNSKEINSSYRFVLLETSGMDNRGLTQQYIRAFIAMNAEFLYVSHNCVRSKSSAIIKELEEYNKAKVILCENNQQNYFEKVRYILSEIELYKPNRLFLHIMPWDVTSLMIVHSTNGVYKYNINLTDHAFWLGKMFVDYNIEFRAYGKSVSIYQRNFKEEQLLLLPFYPILPKEEVPFQGFPKQTIGKTIILTGGAFYKMFGASDLFFKIIDNILDLSTDAVVLIAGDGDRFIMNKKLSNLKNKERVYLIGNRRDIHQVFKACDIYLDTYPLNGGLMEQYASLYMKPILAFSDYEHVDYEQDDMLTKYGNGVKSYNDLNSFLAYAYIIINDINFRKNEGKRNMKLVPSVHDFNNALNYIIKTHSNMYKWKDMNINTQKTKDLYLNNENMTKSATLYLIMTLKMKIFCIFPEYVCHFIPKILFSLYQRFFK